MSSDIQLFSNDVNSPLKQPQQQNQQTREGGQGPTLNGRKQSLSQGLSSPSSVPRPGARRRETTDTNPFSGGITSPTSAGPRAYDTSSWFGRRNLETKEPEALEEDKQPSAAQDSSAKPAVFPGLNRSATASAAGFPASSVWSAATTTPTASAFGGFGNFALSSPGVTDKGFGSSTTGSRFFSKQDGSDNTGAAPATGANSTANANPSWRPRPRTDTDPFGSDDGPGLSGSAALGGARDTSPPPMPTTHGSQIFDTPAKATTSDFGMSGLNLGGSRVASPSQTNPFRSPPAGGDNDHDDLGFNRSHALGGHSEQNTGSNFGSLRGFPSAAAAFEGSDRSQTSSVAGGAKNYPALGNIGGWPSAFSTATPDRERAGFGGAFGNSLFSPMGSEIQSPGLGGIGGGVFGPASSGLGGGTGSSRGVSKLGSLFPPAMQAQMQNPEHDPLADSVPDTLRQPNPLSAMAAGAIGAQSRDTDSPMSIGRGLVGGFQSQPQVNSPSIYSAAEHTQPVFPTAAQNHDAGMPSQVPSFGPEQPAAGPPQSQTRTMVMPDRMLWVYMDPQGRQQGAFSGLDMNEWYKNNFFTNDLRVRKLEDPEFEPLGQLIRRIGNSREPFLVPQVGVLHGAPTQAGATPAGDGRGVIPPLSGVVPSYGKTLTAEEQNNLERRKQEDQIAHARQREYMAQQPHFRGVHPSVSGGLQHQASMHSLQSQPSFGSITSPIGMHQGPIGGVIGGGPAGFFDQPAALNKGPGLPNVMNAGIDHHRGDFSEHERRLMASNHGPSGVSGMFPPQPVGPPTADLKSQLPAVDQLERDPQGFKDRLKEFQEYQGISNQQRPDEEFLAGPSQAGLAQDQADVANRYDSVHGNQDREPAHHQQQQPPQQSQQPQPEPSQSPLAQQQRDLSLTEQVQKAQAANRQNEDPWARQAAATGLPMPFPAPLPASNTPLAAPTAQRRTNIADQYIDTRSRSQTPDSNGADSASAAQPPPLAPWASVSGIDSHKQPSLREIQEAEARVRAKQEAERRANQELEAQAAKEREKVNPIVPGLPSNSTWGSGSPAPSASSPWTKPAGVKPAAVGVPPSAVGTPTQSRKTLAEIQREEEARKRREAKEQSAQPGVAAVSSMGKRYADLASKSGPPGIGNAAGLAAAANAATTVAAGWSTVGAGGKVKIPTAPRAVSATIPRAPVAQVVQQLVKPAVIPANKTNSVPEAKAALQKWLKGNLLKGLNSTHKPDDVVNIITEMGSDKDIIESILYEAISAQSTISPRQLAEEYIRRKRDADKGIFEAPTEPKAGAASGGWSEVAKKSSAQPKEPDVSVGFKTVRKKGKK